MDTAWCCWKPLWSGSVFAARLIVRPTGGRWERRQDGRGRIGTPASKLQSKTFIFIRCGGTFRRLSRDEEPPGTLGRSLTQPGGSSRIRPAAPRAVVGRAPRAGTTTGRVGATGAITGGGARVYCGTQTATFRAQGR